MLTLLTNMSKDVLVQQIQDGLVLLVLGMGTVFLFLTILIFTTKLLSKVCAKIAPAKPQAATTPKKSTVAPQSSGANKDAEIAAAIAAAFARSRN